MGISNFGIFIIATFILNITPGNDFIFVATQSISKGFKAGVYSAFGISIGLLVHISASVLGLSVIISKSIITFEIIKWIGALYLMYLGVKAIIARTQTLSKIKGDHLSAKALLRKGLITNVFNPKVALFFLSFLPQFADAGSPYFSMQLLLLGGWFIFSGTIVSLSIAAFFSRIGNILSKFKLFWKIQQKITGIMFLGLGVRIALFERK